MRGVKNTPEFYVTSRFPDLQGTRYMSSGSVSSGSDLSLLGSDLWPVAYGLWLINLMQRGDVERHVPCRCISWKEGTRELVGENWGMGRTVSLQLAKNGFSACVQSRKALFFVFPFGCD